MPCARTSSLPTAIPAVHRGGHRLGGGFTDCRSRRVLQARAPRTAIWTSLSLHGTGHPAKPWPASGARAAVATGLTASAARRKPSRPRCCASARSACSAAASSARSCARPEPARCLRRRSSARRAPHPHERRRSLAAAAGAPPRSGSSWPQQRDRRAPTNTAGPRQLQGKRYDSRALQLLLAAAGLATRVARPVQVGRPCPALVTFTRRRPRLHGRAGLRFDTTALRGGGTRGRRACAAQLARRPTRRGCAASRARALAVARRSLHTIRWSPLVTLEVAPERVRHRAPPWGRRTALGGPK